MDDTLIKVDDHIDRLENKIEVVVRVTNDHHLKTFGPLEDLEKIHPKDTHVGLG